MAIATLQVLMQTLERNVVDTGAVLDGYEATHSDAELEESRQYQALVMGQAAMREAIERMNRQLNKSLHEARTMSCNTPQSEQSCRLLHHQSSGTRDLRDPRRMARFSEVCRILQGLPGYRLHPSGLVIESVGDLSVLSHEKQAEVYNLMEKDFLARNAKSRI